jgi:molecular chaperone GrpE
MTDKKTSTKKTEDKTKKLEEDLAEMTEYAKRAMADLQNMKRRIEEERQLLTTMANIGLISSLIPIIDNLERGMGHVPEDAKEWAQGVIMSINQLKKMCEDAGLKEIESLGHPFNPELHEALMEGPGEKNTVTEVFEKGYKLGNRVIRHTKVKVGNGEKQKNKS